jgi:hypothetical protein
VTPEISASYVVSRPSGPQLALPDKSETGWVWSRAAECEVVAVEVGRRSLNQRAGLPLSGEVPPDCGSNPEVVLGQGGASYRRSYLIPAASASQVLGVTPSSRSSPTRNAFCVTCSDVNVVGTVERVFESEGFWDHCPSNCPTTDPYSR